MSTAIDNKSSSTYKAAAPVGELDGTAKGTALLHTKEQASKASGKDALLAADTINKVISKTHGASGVNEGRSLMQGFEKNIKTLEGKVGEHVKDALANMQQAKDAAAHGDTKAAKQDLKAAKQDVKAAEAEEKAAQTQAKAADKIGDTIQKYDKHSGAIQGNHHAKFQAKAGG